MPPYNSGFTSLTDLAPGMSRVGFGAARSSPQYADPLQQYFTDTNPYLPEDVYRQTMLRALGPDAQYFPDLFPQERKYDPLTAEEEKGFWETLGHAGMSGVGHAGEILDKYTGSRALRALVGGITGKVPWDRAGRELLSAVPGSDVMGLTDKEDVVWSEEITGLKGPGYSGYRKGLDWGDALNFGLDVILDPTLPLTFGLKGAATQGMRALKKAGHADSFFDAVRSGKYIRPGGAAGMGARETKLTHTLDDVFDWAKQIEADDAVRGKRIRNDLIQALDSDGFTRPAKSFEIADLADNYDAASRHAAGNPRITVPREEILNKPLSGLVGVGVPFRDPMMTIGRGPLAQGMARGMDIIGEGIVNAPIVKHVLPLFDKTLRGALTKLGRLVAVRTTREGAEEAARRIGNAVSLRDEIWKTDIGGVPTHPAKKTLPHSPLWGGEPVEVAIERGIPDAPKGVTFGDMLDPTTVGPEKAMQHHLEVRSFLEGVSEFPEWTRGFGIEERLVDFKGLIDDAAQHARKYGVKLPDLDDVISYIPRQRQLFGLFDKSGKGARVFDVKTQYATGRDPLLKFHPGGTEVLQRMSIDPQISGILHSLPRGVRGTARQLPPEQLAKLRKYVVENYWDDLYGGDFAKHYDPPESLAAALPDDFSRVGGRVPMTDAQAAHIMDPIIQWVARLDPKHAKMRIPVYKLNPFDDGLKYIEHVIETGEAARAVHELFAEAADFHTGLVSGMDAIPIKDALRAVGLEGDQALKQFFETAKTNRAAYRKLKGQMDQAGAAAVDFDNLLVPRSIVEDASRYLRPFSNPTELNPFIKAFDIFTNAFKTGVTTLFPAFHTRNFISGMFNNYVSGMSDPRFIGARGIWQPLADAGALMKGGTIRGAGEIPFVDEAGRIIRYSDEEATRRLMAEIHSNDVYRRGGGSQDPTELLGGGGGGSVVGMEGYQPTIGSVLPTGPLSQIPGLGGLARQRTTRARIMDDAGNWIPENVGREVGREEGLLAAIANRMAGTTASTGPSVAGTTAAMFAPPDYIPRRVTAGRLAQTVPMVDGTKPTFWQKYEEYMPWNLRGVTGDESKYFLARWGEDTAAAIEGYNRIAPFIAFRRKGMTAAEAARRVKAAQVDYSALTKFERTVMKRIFPFYTFTRRMTPFVIEQLVQRPSGAMAQTLRRSSQLRGTGEEANLLPPWVTKGTAIPIPGGEGGHSRYLMSLGLAHEDPLSLVYAGGTPYQTLSGTARQLLSRINPIPRTLIEGATGKTLYGGGDLRFTKPAWAYANKSSESGMLSSFFEKRGLTASSLFGPPPEPSPLKTLTANLYPFMPTIPGQLAYAATGGIVPPGSPRYMTTERILKDPRKKGWPGLVAATTGFKIGDVDIATARNLALNERMKEYLHEVPDVLRAEHLYLRPDVPLERLSPRQQIMLRAYRQQAREQQAIRRWQRQQGEDRMLYPRMPRRRRGGGITPESMLR